MYVSFYLYLSKFIDSNHLYYIYFISFKRTADLSLESRQLVPQVLPLQLVQKMCTKKAVQDSNICLFYFKGLAEWQIYNYMHYVIYHLSQCFYVHALHAARADRICSSVGNTKLTQVSSLHWEYQIRENIYLMYLLLAKYPNNLNFNLNIF